MDNNIDIVRSVAYINQFVSQSNMYELAYRKYITNTNEITKSVGVFETLDYFMVSNIKQYVWPIKSTAIVLGELIRPYISSLLWKNSVRPVISASADFSNKFADVFEEYDFQCSRNSKPQIDLMHFSSTLEHLIVVIDNIFNVVFMKETLTQVLERVSFTDVVFLYITDHRSFTVGTRYVYKNDAIMDKFNYLHFWYFENSTTCLEDIMSLFQKLLDEEQQIINSELEQHIEEIDVPF